MDVAIRPATLDLSSAQPLWSVNAPFAAAILRRRTRTTTNIAIRPSNPPPAVPNAISGRKYVMGSDPVEFDRTTAANPVPAKPPTIMNATRTTARRARNRSPLWRTPRTHTTTPMMIAGIVIGAPRTTANKAAAKPLPTPGGFPVQSRENPSMNPITNHGRPIKPTGIAAPRKPASHCRAFAEAMNVVGFIIGERPNFFQHNSVLDMKQGLAEGFESCSECCTMKTP